VRIEIVFIAGVCICKVYTRSGALAFVGHGPTEAYARSDAAEQLIQTWDPSLAIFADLAQEVADEKRHFAPGAISRALILRVWGSDEPRHNDCK
jgi:hypothetical protein